MASTTIPFSLSQLLQQYTLSEITDAMLAIYQTNGSPVSSWQPFGTERTRVIAEAAGQALISQNYLPSTVAGGYLPLALQVNPDWVPINAEQVYSTFQFPPTTTQGYMQIYNGSDGYLALNSGDLLVQVDLTGNRYFNVNSLNIPPYTTLDGYFITLFQAESTGSVYNDPSNSNLLLVNSIAGVQVFNFPYEDSHGNSYAVNHTGPSLGTTTILSTGSNVNSYINIQIVIAGSVYNQSMYFTFSLNGSIQSDPIQIPVSGLYTIPNSNGVIIDFIDSSSSIPANFYAGDSWLFTIPGDWKILTGTDLETPASLATRAIQSYNLQSDIPTDGFYQRKVKDTPIVGSQVDQVVVFPDPFVGGKLNIVIAGQDGYTSPQVIQGVQNYLNAYSPMGFNILVFPPQVSAINFVGTITVAASSGSSPVPPLPNIQQEIQEAILEYLADIEINGTIKLAAIIKLIMSQVGVEDVAINSSFGLTQLGIVQDGGSPTYVDLSLGNSLLNNYVVPVSAAIGSNLFGFDYIVSS